MITASFLPSDRKVVALPESLMPFSRASIIFSSLDDVTLTMLETVRDALRPMTRISLASPSRVGENLMLGAWIPAAVVFRFMVFEKDSKLLAASGVRCVAYDVVVVVCCVLCAHLLLILAS